MQAARRARGALPRVIAVTIALMAMSLPLGAQKPAKKKTAPSVKAYRLQLKTHGQVPGGKSAFVRGQARPEGDRFFADNLSILQPVVASVRTAKGERVRLQLSKYRWDKADHEAETDGNGVATIRVRTQGEVRVVVSGEKQTPYVLMLWVGDEIEPEMQPIVVRNAAAASPRSLRKYAAPAAMGAGLVLAAVAAVVVSRRKRQ